VNSASVCSWGRLASALLLAGLSVGSPGLASAQVQLLPPEIMAKLTSDNERPLALAPDGEPLRFQTGPERWEEAMPPGIIDVDRDGTKDYIVQIIADESSDRRALIARVWGDAASNFGPTVFYVILEGEDTVVEWAGNPRLDTPVRPKP
jgi:hypothetical protein